jgi:hypothetical protein
MRAVTGVGMAMVAALAAGAVHAANPATITNVEVTPKVNRTKGTKYLSVKFVVHVDEYITSKKALQLNASCKAGDRKLKADTFTGVSVRGLGKGDVKDGGAVLFMGDQVTDEIDDCSLRFELHELGRKYFDKPLSTYCYRGGRVSEGGCE